ncbi:MAG: hypothetical protein Q8M22_03910 [Actinomycetota bacterium]|nr:hypothetical protein [Actinomycetota bacterium]
MDPKISFFFYLGAVIAFAIAAAGPAWKHGLRTRRGGEPTLVLVPLGLALAVFPTMWTVATIAW